MAHFAPRARHDDEETVTRPLLRPAPWMLRKEMHTDHSIELEPATDPNGALPDFALDEEWISTNELPRPASSMDTTITRPRVAPRVPTAERPLPLVKVRQSMGALPPLPTFTRPSSMSRPALPPVPAFTRPIRVGPMPTPIPTPPPAPVPLPPRHEESVVQVREDLRVDWTEVEAVPTNPLSSPIPLVSGYRTRQETVRGIDLSPQMRSVIEAPPIIRYTPLPPPISEVPPCTVPTLAPERASEPQRNFRDLWRAAKADAWTAFLMLPIAVSLVSIVVLSVTALASSSDAAHNENRRIVSATDETGAPVQSATVFVDGVAKCQVTPCSLELADGSHWVSVSAMGYDAPPSRAVAAGSEGPQQIDFVLTSRKAEPSAAATSNVVLAAPPESSRPAAPSAAPAPTPVVERTIPAPSRPRAIAAAPAEATIVRPREVAAVPSKLNINSIPAANVVLDGRPLGRTPKLGIEVSPGAHTIVFVSGKRRVVRSTVVAPGKTAVVAARL